MFRYDIHVSIDWAITYMDPNLNTICIQALMQSLILANDGFLSIRQLVVNSCENLKKSWHFTESYRNWNFNLDVIWSNER